MKTEIIRILTLLLAAGLFVCGYGAWRDGRDLLSAGYAFASACCILVYVERRICRGYLHMKLKKVDLLSGESFEHYLKIHFRKMGYKVRMTRGSGDYGADLILTKRGKKTVVQAKRYAKAVGISAVQEVVGAIACYDADAGMVVTNGFFTKNAKILAAQNEIILWDRKSLKEKFGAEE